MDGWIHLSIHFVDSDVNVCFWDQTQPIERPTWRRKAVILLLCGERLVRALGFCFSVATMYDNSSTCTASLRVQF